MEAQKLDIARQIKNITHDTEFKEFLALRDIGTKACDKGTDCRTGNNIVDYFTFHERLNTKSGEKYNLSFYEFVERIEEFKEKIFVQSALAFTQNN